MARREVNPNDVPSFEAEFLKFADLFGANGSKFVGQYVSDSAGTYGQDYQFKLRSGGQGILTVKGPLKAQLAKAKPVPGEVVTITRTGTKAGTTGEFWLFSVVVDDPPKKNSAPPPPPKDEDVPF